LFVRFLLITAGSALTWTLYLLVQNPDKMAKAQEEVDRVLGADQMPNMQQYGELK
jgi:cytochrome P450